MDLSQLRCPEGSLDWVLLPPALKLASPPVPQLSKRRPHPHLPNTQAGAQNHSALSPHTSLPSSPSPLLEEFQASLPNSLLPHLSASQHPSSPTLGLPEPAPGNTCLSLTFNPFCGDQMLSLCNTRDSRAVWHSHPSQPTSLFLQLPCLPRLTETLPLGPWPAFSPWASPPVTPIGLVWH